MANIDVGARYAREPTTSGEAVRKEGKVRIGDGELYYREAGSGPPLLLIHGIACHAEVFDSVISPLAERWRVIAYDRRGCTRSTGKLYKPKGYFAHHADDASTLLRELDAAPAAVLGWSSGGIVALTLAVEHPDAVKSVVLYEPDLHLEAQRNLDVGAAVVKTLLLGALGLKRRAAKTCMRFALTDAKGRSGFDSLDERMRESVLANADALLAELKAGTGEELTAERLRSIRCPVTDIIGDATAPFYVASSDTLEKLMPQTRILRIPDGNHMTIHERPAEFVSLVIDALGGNGRPV